MEVFLEALSLVMSVVLFALLLAYVCERIVEFFVKPVLERYKLDFWTPYAALIFGAAISVAFGVDLFSPIAAHLGIALLAPWAGYALTAILIGGGSHLIHDVWPVPIEMELLEPIVNVSNTWEVDDRPGASHAMRGDTTGVAPERLD